MAVLSRLQSSKLSCYEVAHPWTPSCARACLDVSLSGFVVALQVYTPLFVATQLLRRRRSRVVSDNQSDNQCGASVWWRPLVTRILTDSVQSSLFLAANCYFFIGSYCAWRRLARLLLPLFVMSHGSSMLAAGVTASLLAIVLEKRQRRSALAVYMLNIASEAAASWLVVRRLAPRVRHLRRVLAVCAWAVLFVLHRASLSDGVLEKLVCALLGNAEVLPAAAAVGHEEGGVRACRLCGRTQSPPPAAAAAVGRDQQPAGARLCSLLMSLLRRIGVRPAAPAAVAAATAATARPLGTTAAADASQKWCRHTDSCWRYALTGLTESMTLGVCVQSALAAATGAVAAGGWLATVLRRRQRLCAEWRSGGGGGALWSRVSPRLIGRHVRLGVCLAALTVATRVCSCALRRWRRGSDSAWHAVPAGGAAALLALSVHSSSSLELYLFWKVVDTCLRLAVQRFIANRRRPRLSGADASADVDGDDSSCDCVAGRLCEAKLSCQSSQSSVSEVCDEDTVGDGPARDDSSSCVCQCRCDNAGRVSRGIELSLCDRLAAIVVYSLSTGVVLALSALEPHHLRSSYWRFLCRLTDNHVTQLNRPLIALCCDADSVRLAEVRRAVIRLQPHMVSAANHSLLRRLGQL